MKPCNSVDGGTAAVAKLSEELAARTRSLWEEAANREFVLEMAGGTLDPGRFRRYMLQDYLYLLDYIGILRETRNRTEDNELKEFLRQVIAGTEDELYRVHIPNMKSLGIDDGEIQACERIPEIGDYVRYMKAQLDEKGLLAGMTALLQCSWIYAYIAETLTETRPEEIAASPYRSWFEAYTCEEYLESNRHWIDVLDLCAEGVSRETADELARIFETCAKYENRLWDAL